MNGRNGLNRVSGLHLSQVSPKVIAAAVLLSLMGLMWLRVLLRRETAPRAAQAQTETAAPEVQTARPLAPIVQSRPLAVQKGYHDRLHRDPFASAQSWWYGDRPRQEAAVTASLSSEEERQQAHEANLRAISESLTLEAIVLNADGSRKAFVGGRMVTEGTTLRVARNGTVYELTAQSVSDTEVSFTWQAFSITVHMAPSEKVDARKDGVL